MVAHIISDAVVIFALGELRFALGMDVVERVVRAVEVSPLPDAPPGVMGVVNVHGRIIPVLDFRPRLGLPSGELRLSDHLVIAHAGQRQVAVMVDAAVDVMSAGSAPATLATGTLPKLTTIEGVMMLGDEIVLIHDLSRFLPEEVQASLDRKLNS
jgi:purine-binding chemotaxis protein CheW